MLVQNYMVPFQGCGCGGLGMACGCRNVFRNKCGSCPKCGAPIWELSTVTLHWYSNINFCQSPRIEYSCNCRYDHCAPVFVPPTIVVQITQPPRSLSKKRSGRQW